MKIQDVPKPLRGRAFLIPAITKPARSLGGQALRGSAWTVAGYGAAQVLRLVNNLILTRLLAPEIFGVSALVYVFLQALEMFSDIGIAPSIIRSPRGEDPEFLNTAWSIQIVRGFVLWVGSLLIAWPLARVYGTPEFAWLLPVAGLSAIVQGCTATTVPLASRRMALGRLTMMELYTQAVTLALTAALALAWHSIWAVVVGNLLGALARLAFSFTLLPGARNRWAWDKASASSIIHFGKWLTLSTMLTYVCASADRVILGYHLGVAELGVYSIAFMMSQVTLGVVKTLAGRVFFPLFSRLAVSGVDDMKNRLRRLHAALLVTMLPPVWVLVIWGPKIIEHLYDKRYHDAGWMLRILAAGTIVAVITANVSSILLAKGDSRRHMLLLALRAAVLLGSMGVGGRVAGVRGLIIGIAAEPLICYPVMAMTSRRYGAWMPGLDFTAVLTSAVVITLGLSLVNP